MRSTVWQHALVVILASVATGLAIPFLSTTVVIVLIGAAALVAAAYAIRQAIPRLPRLAQVSAVNSSDDGRFRTPRMLLYGGLLTSCWLQVRFHGVTLSDGLFLLAVGAALVEQGLSRRADLTLPDNLWIGVLLFTVSGCISTLQNSSHQLSSFAIIARVFYLVVAWLWTGGVSLRTREHVWTAMKCWVFSAAVCGAWALGQKYAHLPGNLDNGRFAGLADHVNDLGALCACATVPALALVYRDRRWSIAFLGIAVGLLLSESIGGAAAAIVALLFGLVVRELTKPTLIALAVGAIAIVLASPLIGSSAITRFSTATNSGALITSQNTFGTRTRIYGAAWRKIDHDPFIGRGLDVPSSSLYDETTGVSFEVHNLFLGSWYEGGVLSLIGIVMMIWTLGSIGWRAVTSTVDRLLSLAVFAGFIAYVVDELSEPSLYKRYSLVPALLIVALYRLQAERVSQERATRVGVDLLVQTYSR